MDNNADDGPRGGRKSDVNEPGVKRRQLRILWRCEGAVSSVELSVVATTKDRMFQIGVNKCVIKALTR